MKKEWWRGGNDLRVAVKTVYKFPMSTVKRNKEFHFDLCLHLNVSSVCK